MRWRKLPNLPKRSKVEQRAKIKSSYVLTEYSSGVSGAVRLIPDISQQRQSAGAAGQDHSGLKESDMRIDWFVKFLLLVIAIFLGLIALRPYVAPPPVQAQAGGGYPLHFEPSAVWLPSPNGGAPVVGKVVIDLRNGKIWGFPGFTQDTFVVLDNVLPTSHPVLLGKYALAELDK
jgi:hypothetical protein